LSIVPVSSKHLLPHTPALRENRREGLRGHFISSPDLGRLVTIVANGDIRWRTIDLIGSFFSSPGRLPASCYWLWPLYNAMGTRMSLKTLGFHESRERVQTKVTR